MPDPGIALYFDPFSQHSLGDRLFDCMFAGTIPVYWGGRQMSRIIFRESALLTCAGLRTMVSSNLA